MRRIAAGMAALAVLATACSNDEEAPSIETGEVVSTEVVETVVAAGFVQPAAQETALAPAPAEVAALFVSDGDEVNEGDELLRLTSTVVEDQLEQARAAVDAADDLAGTLATSTAGGPDVGGIIEMASGQLDQLFPPIVAALEAQVDALEDARGATDGLATLADSLPEVGPVPEPLRDVLGDTPAAAAVDQALSQAGEALDDVRSAAAGVAEAAEAERRAQLDQARQSVRAAEAAYAEARSSLAAVEQDLAAGADAAAAGAVAQREAISVQREQAEAVLAASEARAEALTVRAPGSGVVELARPARQDASLAALAGLGGLQGLGDAGGLANLGVAGDSAGAQGLDGGLPFDLGAADPAGPGDPGDPDDDADADDEEVERYGPVVLGQEVAIGEPLATVYDLSSFEVLAEVDEIDVVHVEEGQGVTVLVDAFPSQELRGRVEYVAIAPERQPAGGTVFPVTVTLTDVPDEVDLRVGLTASVEIEVRRVEASTAVPTSALLRSGGDEVVYVDRDGTAEAVIVRVLAIGEQYAAVEALDAGAIEAGDEVVTVGVEQVEDGTELPE